jgi:magnesium transporter
MKLFKRFRKNLNRSLGAVNPLLLKGLLFRKDGRMQLFMEQPEDTWLEVLNSVTLGVRKDILRHIPDESVVRVLEMADPDDATDFLQLLGPKKRGRVLEMTDPDDATDMLQLLGPKKRERVLQLLSQDLKDSLSTLLEFDAETAAGLMTLDYIQADVSDNVSSVAKKFKEHEKRTGRPPVILMLKDDKLVGFLPGHELGFAAKTELVGKYTKRIPSISYAAHHDEVFDMFRSHPHAKVAVLNDEGNVVGIIYSDDVLKVMQEHEASSLYDFAGISKEETVSDSARKKVEHRYKWLIINLATAFLAAFTIGMFEDTLHKYVLLAIYMPIVAGMGGNAATQTLAVLVRGIALKQIELRTAFKTLKNEVSAGAINGFINGLIVAVVVIILNHDVRLAIVLALAMVINLLVAAFFGTIVPLIMSKLGKDPAASATIFITTATDVLGFMAFLSLATVILK